MCGKVDGRRIKPMTFQWELMLPPPGSVTGSLTPAMSRVGSQGRRYLSHLLATLNEKNTDKPSKTADLTVLKSIGIDKNIGICDTCSAFTWYWIDSKWFLFAFLSFLTLLKMNKSMNESIVSNITILLLSIYYLPTYLSINPSIFIFTYLYITLKYSDGCIIESFILWIRSAPNTSCPVYC